MRKSREVSLEREKQGVVPCDTTATLNSAMSFEMAEQKHRYDRLLAILLQADIKVFEALSKQENA